MKPVPEPEYIKCECGNDVFKVEIVGRTKYTQTGPLQIHFYARCTECGNVQQI